jgi:hypothetical protein
VYLKVTGYDGLSWFLLAQDRWQSWEMNLQVPKDEEEFLEKAAGRLRNCFFSYFVKGMPYWKTFQIKSLTTINYVKI